MKCAHSDACGSKRYTEHEYYTLTNFQFMILRVLARISHRVLYLTISDIVTFFDCKAIFFPVEFTC